MYRTFFPETTDDDELERIIKNPLSFWKKESLSIYGELMEVAINMFQIPTGSASVERHFSLHNRIVPDLRSNLSESILEMLSFIKANKKQVDSFYQIGKHVSTKHF